MKKNVNVFIAVLLVAVLCGGVIWLQTADEEKLGWNIHDSYGDTPSYSGGAAYTNATFAGPFAGEGGVMTLSPSRTMRHSAASSYAGAYTISNGVSLSSSPNSLIASSPLSSAPSGAGLYTTSSKTFNSYGGGGNGGAATGGSVRGGVSTSQPAVGGSIAYAPSPISYTTSRRQAMPSSGDNPAMMAAENPMVAMANAANAANAGMNTSFYGGMYATADYSSADYGQYSGMFGGGSRMGVRGRQGTTTFDDAWTNWLLGWLQENGYTSADFNGNGIIDDDELAIIYAALQGDSNTGMGMLPTEDDIRDFLTASLPVGDIAPLLLIALLYVLFVAIKSNALKSLIKTKRSE